MIGNGMLHAQLQSALSLLFHGDHESLSQLGIQGCIVEFLSGITSVAALQNLQYGS